MNSSSSKKPQPLLERPTIEYFLKQVYAIHKEEVKSLSNKLSEANTKLSKKTLCHFCTTLKDQVESLNRQVELLLQERQKTHRNIADASVQTDMETATAEGSKRTMKFSLPRKRAFVSLCRLDTSPSNKNCAEEVILAPNTPERNPQREARVKKWLETVEIAETVDPFMATDKLDFSPPVYDDDKEENKNEEDMQHVSKVRDMDETMLPLTCMEKARLCKDPREGGPQELNNSYASSEDLLDGAISHPLSVKNSDGKVLADVGNKSESLRGCKEILRAQGHKRFKYKAEPVRKKEERRQLPGQQCADCARFYEGEDGARQRELCSKHRATNVAPSTPDNFWELDFPDTQVCKERGYMDITQKVKVQSKRRRPFNLPLKL